MRTEKLLEIIAISIREVGNDEASAYSDTVMRKKPSRWQSIVDCLPMHPPVLDFTALR